MGIACALGVVLALHLTASGAEPRWRAGRRGRALPLVAVTLYFTFSRGAIWALPVGLVALRARWRSRAGCSAALPAAGSRRRSPSKVAYGADCWRAPTTTTGGRGRPGPHVLVVVRRLRGRRGGAARGRAAARPRGSSAIRLPRAGAGRVVAARASLARRARWSARARRRRSAADRRRARDVHARASYLTGTPTCATG